MRRKIMFLSAIILLAVSIVACSDLETQPTSSSDLETQPTSSSDPALVQTPPSAPVADFWFEDAGVLVAGTIYPGSNQIGAACIQGAMDELPVAERMSWLLSQGYIFDPLGSKHIEMVSTVGGMILQTNETILAFYQVTAEGDSRALIRRRNYDNSFVVTYLEKIYIGENPWSTWTSDENSFVEYVGIDDDGELISLQGFAPDTRWMINRPCMAPTRDPDQMSYEAMIACVYRRAPIACAAASIKCLFTSEPKSECIERACAEAVLRVTAECVTEWFFGTGN